MDHVGEVFFCHLDGERLDFAGPDWGDAAAYRRQGEAADAVKEASHGQHGPSIAGPGGWPCSFMG